MEDALTLSVKDDSNDKAIDTEDTRHNDGNDRLEDELGLEDTHAADADATLCGAVGSAEVYLFKHGLSYCRRRGRQRCPCSRRTEGQCCQLKQAGKWSAP